MTNQLQSGSIQIFPNEGLENIFFYKEALNINKQAASIIGNSNWGPSLIPTPYKIFKDNSLNSFVINNDFFLRNHKEFQGNILPYISAYSILNSNGQLNFTRLTGINLPDFPILKPGFKLENNYKIYLLTTNITILNHQKGYYNCDEIENKNYYQGILISKNCELNIEKLISNDFSTTDNFLLGLTNPINGFQNKLKVGNINITDQTIQDKIFTFENDDKPNNIIKFNFNINNEFYWKNTLNTNIQRIDDFGYVFYNYNDVLSKIGCDIKDVEIQQLNLFELTHQNFKNFNEESKCSTTPWIVSQGFYNNNQNTDRESIGLNLKDRVIKLFKIHAINPGKFANNIVIKIIPVEINTNGLDFSIFNLHLINKENEQIIYRFNNMTLDPDSSNFIGRIIGTSEIIFDPFTQRITEQGDYAIQNPWIRVELSDAVLNKTILPETIPAGYLGVNKIMSTIIPGHNYSVLNEKYTLIPQFSSFFNNNVSILNSSHAWGKNLKNLSTHFQKIIKNNIRFTKFQKDINSPAKNVIPDNNINTIKYHNNNNQLIINRHFEENHYLNSNFYQNPNEDNYDDMFHLEKILLLNQFDNFTSKFKQYWQLSKYIQSGSSTEIVTNNENFWKPFFEDNTDLDKLYYYFTINKKGTIDTNIDSITEAKQFDINILNFNIEMTGGWDGLNLLDINEYSINNQGLESSEYLRELYKIALKIVNDEVNGQNEIIYLPDIFNQEIIEYACSLIENNKYSLLFIDKPLYNKEQEIIYGKNVIKLNKNFMTPRPGFEYNWSDQKYIYITNPEVDNLKFSQDVTVSKWREFTNSINNVASFSNYIDMILPSGHTTNRRSIINNSGIEHEYMVPSSLFALCLLLSTDQKMNPIFNSELNSFGELQVYWNIEDSIDELNTRRNINIQQINDLNVNILFLDIIRAKNTYRFMSDKTNQFYTNNLSLLSKLNVRNTLNDIKKNIKLSSYSILFSNIKSIKDISNQTKSIYTTVLTKYLSRGLISNFKIILDETTSSNEDLLQGLIRGIIYITFPNQQTINFDIN